MASAEFWYEFASTYSYPAALRVAALADERGVSLVWRPFLLGPIFLAQGWRNSPFNIYPAKGRYMWRDLERTCGAMGVPSSGPSHFRSRACSPRALRSRLKATERSDFSRRVFVAEFGQGLPIGDRATLSALLEECGVEPTATIERAQGHANKARLKADAPVRPRSESSARLSRDGRRRSVLGQRPARTGARLGGRRRRRDVTRFVFLVRWRAVVGRIGDRAFARAERRSVRERATKGRRHDGPEKPRETLDQRMLSFVDPLGRLLTDGFHILALFAIGAATVWAAAVAFYAMVAKRQRHDRGSAASVYLSRDGSMVGIYFRTNHMPVRFLLYVGITALTRHLIGFVQHEEVADIGVLILASGILSSPSRSW